MTQSDLGFSWAKKPLLSQVILLNHTGTHIFMIELRSRNIISSNHILPTILNHSVSLFGNILYVSCRHRQINMTEESLNCEWISRPGCHGGSGSAKSVEACSLRRMDYSTVQWDVELKEICLNVFFFLNFSLSCLLKKIVICFTDNPQLVVFLVVIF